MYALLRLFSSAAAIILQCSEISDLQDLSLYDEVNVFSLLFYPKKQVYSKSVHMKSRFVRKISKDRFQTPEMVVFFFKTTYWYISAADKKAAAKTVVCHDNKICQSKYKSERVV